MKLVDMATPTEDFPGFAELCEQARKVEKKRLSAPPGTISGNVDYDASSVIFPKEFEEYTYPYLLSSAQKIEQRLFTAKFTSSSQPAAPQAPAEAIAGQKIAPSKAAAKAVEEELRAFAEAQQVQQETAAPGPEAPMAPKQGSIFQFFSKKKAAAQAPQMPAQQPAIPAAQPAEPPAAIPSATQAISPPVPPIPASGMQGRQPAPPAMAPPRRILPSISSIQPDETEEKEIEKEKSLEIGGEAEEKEMEKGESLGMAEEAQAGKEEGPQAEKETGPDAPEAERQQEGGMKSIISSSKISPRLRKIIEEKLRKEEAQKKAERQEQLEISRQASQEEEAAEEEALEAEEAPEEGQKEEEIPPRPRMRRPVAEEEAEGPEEEPKEGEEAEGEEIPKAEKPVAEEEALTQPEPTARPSGPLTIKPIFPGEKQGGRQPSSPEDAESDLRLKRLQRIIDDLSPTEKPPEEEAAPEEGEEAPAAEGEKPPAKKIPIKAAKPSTAKKAPKPAPIPAAEKAPAAKKSQQAKPVVAVAKKTAAAPIAKAPATAARPVPVAKAAKVPIAKSIPAKPSQVPAKKTAAAPIAKAQAPIGKAAQVPAPAAPAKKMPLPKPVPRAAPVYEEETIPAPQPRSRIVPPQPAQPSTGARPRILPGGIVLGKGAQVKTYIPPARKPMLPTAESEGGDEGESRMGLPLKRKPVPKEEDSEIPEGETEAAEEDEEPAETSDEQPQSQEAEEAEEGTETGAPKEDEKEAAEEEERTPQQVSRFKMTRLASAEGVPQQKTPEQLSQDARMARMAEQLSRIESLKPKEIAGKATLPSERLEIPSPPKPSGAAPVDYGAAKESLKVRLEKEEIAGITRQKDEESLEQYAKENIVWLYEIYKMGGITREDFLSKVREKLSEGDGGGKPPPENPALAALGKEIERKSKK